MAKNIYFLSLKPVKQSHFKVIMESFLKIVEEKIRPLFPYVFLHFWCGNSSGNSFVVFLMFFYIKIGFFGKLSKINFNWIFFEIKLYSLYYKDLESFKEFLSDSH